MKPTPLPGPPVGALTDGEAAMLKAWAERYADARVREALEEAAKICDTLYTTPADGPESEWGCGYVAGCKAFADAIRRLMP